MDLKCQIYRRDICAFKSWYRNAWSLHGSQHSDHVSQHFGWARNPTTGLANFQPVPVRKQPAACNHRIFLWFSRCLAGHVSGFPLMSVVGRVIWKSNLVFVNCVMKMVLDLILPPICNQALQGAYKAPYMNADTQFLMQIANWYLIIKSMEAILCRVVCGILWHDLQYRPVEK